MKYGLGVQNALICCRVFSAVTIAAGKAIESLLVQVEGDAEMTPRQRLTSAPYAFRAAEADSSVTSPLDPIAAEYRRNCTLVPVEGDYNSVTVLEGTLAIPNETGDDIRVRKNAASTIIDWSDIDGVSTPDDPDTQYYVYAVADAPGTDFTFLISTSTTTPSVATYYRKIGYFYNDSSDNIRDVGNIKGGDVANTIEMHASDEVFTTSTDWVDTDLVIHFYSSGRPVRVLFKAKGIRSETHYSLSLIVGIDGTDKMNSIVQASIDQNHLDLETAWPTRCGMWQETLGEGTHTAALRYRVPPNPGGSTNYLKERVLIVEEL